MSFITLYVAGVVRADAIDDYVERWHTTAVTAPLHDYLGLTHEEYGRWLRDASALPDILQERIAAPAPTPLRNRQP